MNNYSDYDNIEEAKILGNPDPRSAEQLGILVLDGSGTMGKDNKAKDVEEAVKGLIEHFQFKSTRAKDILLSIICYDNNVEGRLPPTPIVNIPLNSLRANPYEGMGGETAIGDALFEAKRIADIFLSGEKKDMPRSCVIMLMSDGKNNSGRKPLEVSEMIKTDEKFSKKVRIVSVAYGNDADKETLRKICSTPSDYTEAHDSMTLRSFFIASLLRLETGIERTR